MPEAAAHKLQETVDEITGYGRRTRKLVWGLVSITFASVLLVVGTGYLFIRVHDSQLDSCTASNQSRAQQEQLWTTFLAIAAGPHPAPSVLPKLHELQHAVSATYTPVNCQARYPLW
jgi:hypothetical protein